MRIRQNAAELLARDFGFRAAVASGDEATAQSALRNAIIDGAQLTPSTSVGIAIAPFDGGNTGTLLKNADLALYRAKETGRGTFAYFEEGLNARAQERRELESDLRLAIERGEFELHYQPLFDLDDNSIGSFQALIRWNHPRRGLVSPIDFIPLAEDTGLIVPIGAWIVREACRRAAAWPAGAVDLMLIEAALEARDAA